MLKAILFSVFTSTAILIGAFFADGVVIDHNTPETLNPGEKKIVSICVNKGEVAGFAKLQLEIPAGLTVRPIKKSGASFTFSGQKAKFIWMTLPDTQNFCVEYEIEANTATCGPKVITGQFSYIKENERIDYEVDAKTIQVGSCGEVVDNVNEDNQSSSTANSTNTSMASCKRTVTEITPGEFLVELECANVQTDGFAKYIENVSSDYTISEDNNGDAIATISDNSIKYVWFESPSDDSFSVSYKLNGAAAKDPNIQGEFTFVSDNTPKSTSISNNFIANPNSSTLVEETQTESNEVINSTDPTEEIVDNNSSLNKNTQSESDNIPTDASSLEETSSIPTEDLSDNSVADLSASDVPDAEEGITYKVQLAATHKYMNGAKFKTAYKFQGTIQLENHEGWTKYVTGSHGEYKDARDARNSITSAHPKFRGPFVTAYNYGERITVQEALMISKQKWYQ